ncbi:MAG TPA: peptidase M23 [Pseudonocardiaceae bacterium]|nr:peptidase M23 [Pseudonocardiaceae bacterium]
MSQPVGMTATSAGPTSGGAARPKLERAFLELRKPPTAPGSLDPGPRYDRIDFQFNPKELSISKAAKWSRNAQKNNKNSGIPEFGGPEPSKLALEMFLDASDTQDDSVVKTVEKLLSCCVPTPDSQTKKIPNPPWAIFHWGGLTSFTGYIKSVTVKYTVFTPGGLPIRGTATINLEEISKEDKKQNPTSGALSAHRVHTVLAGDSLASIAWSEYGDPTMWRVIATVNRLDDPMRLRAGSSLFVPAVEDLHGGRVT